MQVQTQTQSSGGADAALLQQSLLEPETLSSPNAYYRALRRDDPVRFDEKIGMYLVSRYEDLWTVAQDSTTFSVGHAWMKTFATGRFDEFKEILISKGGGYFLRRDPADITFGEVIRVLEGPLAAVPCVSQTAYMKCAECVDEPTCGVRLAMKEVRDATARILDHTTLADVNARTARKRRKSR